MYPGMYNALPAAVIAGLLLSDLERGSTDKRILNPPKMFYFSFEKMATDITIGQHAVQPRITSELVRCLH